MMLSKEEIDREISKGRVQHRAILSFIEAASIIPMCVSRCNTSINLLLARDHVEASNQGALVAR